MRTVIAAAMLAFPISAQAHSDDTIVAANELSVPPATLNTGKLTTVTEAKPAPARPAMRDGDGIPDQLDAEQRAGYRTVFAAIRTQRWNDATIALAAMKPGPLHAIAKAELYTARNSPKVELPDLLALLAEAPELPQADQIRRMAMTRGATETPALPVVQRLAWYGVSPVRQRIHTVSTDNAATEMALAVQPFVKSDDGASAEALLETRAANLSPESLTEWQQKVAWIYYTAGDDSNARRMAAKAEVGVGEWTAPADWVAGLAAWRQNDCAAAGQAFETVAQRASDTEMRSAGLYWASRADMACGHPEKVAGHLSGAAQYGETFYGLLARQALGIEDKPIRGETRIADDWRALERRPNVRVAAALVEIGENDLADEVLRYQAKLETPSEHASLTRLAGRLNLASTQLWLSHNGPAGGEALVEARYPAPNWTPDGGWRVDRNLVFAHTLQESRFNSEIRSAAGAMGLMQVKPIAATDVGRRRGVTYAASDLTKPSVNMEIGQSYLEQLRDSPTTGGLLPKVIAAYNAGPTPVDTWNAGMKDNGDPLLYIESIPYWETRGYVMTVLRNYWMYELQAGQPSPSRTALTQGLWPKFPGLPGPASVRMSARTVPSGN